VNTRTVCPLATRSLNEVHRPSFVGLLGRPGRSSCHSPTTVGSAKVWCVAGPNMILIASLMQAQSVRICGLGSQPGCCGNRLLKKKSGAWDWSDKHVESFGVRVTKFGDEFSRLGFSDGNSGFSGCVSVSKKKDSLPRPYASISR